MKRLEETDWKARDIKQTRTISKKLFLSGLLDMRSRNLSMSLRMVQAKANVSPRKTISGRVEAGFTDF